MLSNRWVAVLVILVGAMAGRGMAQDASHDAAPDAPQVKFGTTVVIPAGLRGIVYHIRPGSTQLPDFARLKPKGTIYTSSLNVPPQSFLDGFPGVTRRFEWFAIDYTGRFWIETAGRYRFALTSDDGADLWIDGRKVIDNDGQHPAAEASGAADLVRGVHRIRVSYFQGPREQVALILKIAHPGQPLRVFSTDDFKPPADAVIDTESTDHQVLIDNEYVHVTQTVLAPHEKTALEEHALNRVMVFLDKGGLEIRDQEGHTDKPRFRAGQAVWTPAAGSETTENTGRDPIRMVEIDLKKPAPVSFPARSRELDPVAIDPKHNILVFENEQVRVFKSWREPGASEHVHEHSGVGRVAVFLTDTQASVHSGGTETPLEAAAGEVTWSGPATHAAVNTGRRKFEMIVIEVK